jgi:hypothetical protein
MTLSTHYDAHQKLEAVERAIGMCKRAAPSLIAKGHMTQGQVSNLLDTLKQVTFDYNSQAFETKGSASPGCSRLSDVRGSDSLTRVVQSKQRSTPWRQESS